MDKLRFGIVGVGMMGREHIRNLKLHPEAEIVALQDPVPECLERGVKQLGRPVATYAEIPAMLAEAELDCVLVVSPNYTHRAVLEPLFAAGLNILCEKPLCTTIADARWAAEQAKVHAAVFWTGMEYRFMPPAARFIAAIEGGEVGRLVQLSIREHRFPFLQKVGDWNRFSRNTGGTMVEKCCHFFDLMRLIVKAEPVRVFCSGAMDVNHLDERYDGQVPDIIDNSFTVVDFANGVRALLDLNMFAEGSEEQEALTAVGDQAKLEAFIPSGDLVHSPRVPLGQPKRPVRTHVAVDPTILAAGTHHGSTYYQIEAFIDAVRGRAPVQVTAQDGLMAVAIGVAAETSAREKRVVEMSELGF
ncbi:Gfo/Idh/MocA family protein [Phenylobacterium aquaticum]|uniref:Gfo/Idh/MocA family protein n=1 Tax=Phenylobacterium aquaticum TaxID=1763816 RepID=UPI0026EFF67C|nr:Gfo/Idh/MocA family oxidoreductase [Phenylobacterium aquaticum]